MNIKQFGILVDRYLAGKASAPEIKAIDQWLDQRSLSDEGLTEISRRRLQNEMLQKIRQAFPNQGAPERSLIFRFLKPFMQVAAMLVVFIGLFFLYQNYREHGSQSETGKPVQYETFRTPKGRKATLTLSDSSVIFLNAATVIRYPRHFQGPNREVILDEGEAFFEITPNVKKPFIVHTAHQIDTRVLGTSFNISSYSATERLSLSVNTGRVQVSKSTDKIRTTMGIFTAGQGFDFAIKGGTFKRSNMDAADIMAWKNNILILKDADFNELKQKLENWYGIEVNLMAKPDASVLFTGRFFNKSLHEVLNALQRINNFQYEFKENKLKIENKIKHQKSERKPM